METKKCTKCYKLLPINEFYVKREKGKSRLSSHCKKCHFIITKKYSISNKEYLKTKNKQYYLDNKSHINSRNKAYADDHKELWKIYREEHKEEINLYNRLRNRRIKELFLEMYGNKCSCCGETYFEFLTIEHIKGQKGIKASKKELGNVAYGRATKEYRPDLYTILCWNCNCSKGRYGYCPHQKSI